MKHFYVVKVFDVPELNNENIFYIDIEVTELDTAKTLFNKLTISVGDELQNLGLARNSYFTFQKL